MAAAALAVLEDARVRRGVRARLPGRGGDRRDRRAPARGPEDLRPHRPLVVLPDRVLVADFKTNRPRPPHRGRRSGLSAQMALYAAVLAEVFPGRRIEAALVWTDGPKLMPIPEILLAQALADLGRGG
jgi:ATP-dependent helicase/nuclease subunit A